MIEISNNNVLIPLSIWNELKENEIFKEIIEAIENNELSGKTKKESMDIPELDDYILKRYDLNLKNFQIKKNT